MQFLRFIRKVINALASTRKMAKMSSEELLSLNDEELYNTVTIRLAYDTRWKKSDNYAEFHDGAKRVFYVISQYDEEVNNGGLCQYFVNSSRLAAPYLLKSLNELGVSEHAKLLSDFLTTNNIDVNDLSSFIIKDLSEFQEQNKKYPFDNFDETFYELYKKEPLYNCLIAYVRQHIEQFI